MLHIKFSLWKSAWDNWIFSQDTLFYLLARYIDHQLPVPLHYTTAMIPLQIAESKALHEKIVQGVSLDAIRSPEEASGLLAEAMEHERLSRMYKDFTAFQLERAREDAHSAEYQLKSAEEYMCLITNTIRCWGLRLSLLTPMLRL